MNSAPDRPTTPEDPIRQRLVRLRGLVGGFAHEIKNPLSTIGLNLRLMEEELAEPLSARERRILDRTRRLTKEVDRLQAILEEFLNYVRAPEPVIQRVSLNEIVREVADLLAPEIEARGISLKLLLSEGLRRATVDARLVHQALLNLVRNAEQALTEIERPGEIIVSTAFENDGERGWHVLTVTDSGPGMAPQVLARCFQPYFSTKRGGTGLGLAITRRLIEDHGGEISVDSHEGIGTRFVIRLPFAEPADGEDVP